MATQYSGSAPSSREEARRRNRSRLEFEKFLSQHELGESMKPEEYFKKHPELEQDLRKLFGQLEKKLAKEEDLLKSGMQNGQPRVLGDFKIIEKIGSGGMATVFEAEQISLKRNVALKVLPAHLSFSDEAVRKFKREAEAGGRQSHPGIVSIYSVGEQDGMHYIAEELVPGGRTLADQLEDLRRLPTQPMGYFREAAMLVAEVAEALEDAHATGVIHRDVKPSNLLLTDDGRPMVTDFGLAKVQDALSLSRTGEFAGTPFYMSPEQAMSRRIGIDHRTDIYSLGVTLYEMLTLKRPFEGKTSHEILKKIILIDPRNPSKVNPRVPRDLSIICLKAMEKDPSKRYQSMEEFGDDLRRFLNAELIVARPSPLCTRVRKYIRRHPVCSAAAAVAVVALIAIGVGIGWTYSEIWKQKRQNDLITIAFIKALLNPNIAMSFDGSGTFDIQERLRSIAKQIGAEFDGKPELAAHARHKLGKAFMSYGFHQDALPELETAAEMMSEILGGEKRRTIEIKVDLATTLTYLDMLTDAERLWREILTAWEPILGEFDTEILKMKDGLAAVLGRMGRLKEAEVMHREVLEKAEVVWGKQEADTLTVKNNLAGVLTEQWKLNTEQWKLDEAEALYREVLKGRKEEYTLQNRYTLRAMNNLAYLLVSKGEFQEAERLYLEALEILIWGWGEEDTDAQITMNNLATLLRTMDRSQDAEKLYEKVLAIQLDELGAAHPDTIKTKYNLATFFVDTDRLGEAEALFKEIMTALEENEAKEESRRRFYRDKYAWMQGLGELYLLRGDLEKAGPLFKDVLAGRRRTWGDESPHTLNSMVRVSMSLLQTGKLEEAETLLAAAIPVAGRVLPHTHRDRLALHKIYHGLLQLQGRFDEMVPHLEACYEGFKEVYGADNMGVREIVQDLIDLHEKLGNGEKVKEYRALLEGKNDTEQ